LEHSTERPGHSDEIGSDEDCHADNGHGICQLMRLPWAMAGFLGAPALPGNIASTAEGQDEPLR
jgi:hypothetical protein